MDIASSNLWLKTAIYSMQLSQMIIQAMWIPHDSQLKQLPYFEERLIESLKKAGVEDIPDFMNMDDHARDQHISQLSQQQVADIAATCNRFPIIEIASIQSPSSVYTADIMELKI